tara:strand:- start:509 stop:1717 length:1209 start_codon:yes stop_codon:yes gene_type:complete
MSETTYYKGNNMGLSFDGTGWSLTNTPKDFIDLNAFSTPDPVFPTAPTTPTTPTEPEEDPCPPGYVYDETLKQCVIDPNAESNFMQTVQDSGNTQERRPIQIAGTDRTTMNGNFIATDKEYNKMTPQELVENYKQRGMISKNENGNLVIDISPDMGDNLFDSQLARFGQGGETDAGQRKHLERLLNKGMINSKLNSELMRLYPMGATAENFPLTLLNKGNNAKIVIPTTQSSSVKGITNTEFTPGFGQLTYAGFSPDIVAKFTNYINNGIAGGQGLTPVTQSFANIKTGEDATTSVGGIITEGDKISDDGRGIITDSSGDTYTPTSDGQGYTFKSDDPKPSVQQPISKGSTQTYGAGRGGTASQQQEMKKQDTRNNNFSPQDRNIQPAKSSKGYSGPAFGRR